MLGDIAGFTGWTFQQIGQLTVAQVRVVLGAMNRRRKEQIEMWGGTVSENPRKAIEQPDEENEVMRGIERKLQMLKAQTGKTKFDLREVI